MIGEVDIIMIDTPSDCNIIWMHKFLGLKWFIWLKKTNHVVEDHESSVGNNQLVEEDESHGSEPYRVQKCSGCSTSSLLCGSFVIL